ncbi:MAG: ABC transporter permease, partial [Lachnospiraceae bacterium]|nr:ABC transporter permease [Lachnospiraceae bacterium]
MNNIAIIFQKQIKDILKNKTVLIEFIIFPLMAFIMTKTVQIQDMPAGFFVKLFAVMYIGMAPLTGMSAIIAEEKEKNTLRVLLMADVTPAQY